jgi:arsenate reductase (glutaredoxin)
LRHLFHLGNCDTCQKIIKQWQPADDIVQQNIKMEPITEAQIDEMSRLTGSYEALFSRVAMKYKSMGLKDQNLQEADYRRLILEEYTFLKRPVLVLDERIFVGNSPKNVAAAQAALLEN